MKCEGKNNTKFLQTEGFTILEVIVAINLSFLLLTFIVSFYLFTYKLSSTIQTKIITNNDINNFLYRIEEKLQRADKYFIESAEGQILIVVNDADSISITDSLLNFTNIFLVDSFDKFSIEIITDEAEIINHSLTKEEESFVSFGSELIESEKINSIKFSISSPGKTYSSVFYRSRNSAIGFRNIR